MNRSEMVAAVREIRSGILDNDAVDRCLDDMEASLPHADICDLMFHDFRDLTPENIVDESYRREAEHVASWADRSAGTFPVDGSDGAEDET